MSEKTPDRNSFPHRFTTLPGEDTSKRRPNDQAPSERGRLDIPPAPGDLPKPEPEWMKRLYHGLPDEFLKAKHREVMRRDFWRRVASLALPAAIVVIVVSAVLWWVGR